MHSLYSLRRATALAIAVFGYMTAPVTAHEFWIEPDSPRAEVGETVRAELRVGRMLNGEAYPYLSDQIVSAQVHAPSGITDIAGMEGDLPAFSMTPTEPGLHVLTYHAVPNYVVFEDMPSFVTALAYEGLGEVAELHKTRRLPDTDIAEGYIRNVRALIQVGPVGPEDVDRPTGMPIELIALQNPYAEGLAETEVQLLWQGAPLPNRQVSIFHRPAGSTSPEEVARTLVTTDAEGQAAIPISEGGFFLLNAVQMKPVSGPGDVVWESHWASLTFTVEEP